MIEQMFGVAADTTMDVGSAIIYMLVAAVFGLIIGGVYFAVCKKEKTDVIVFNSKEKLRIGQSPIQLCGNKKLLCMYTVDVEQNPVMAIGQSSSFIVTSRYLPQALDV